MKKGFTKKCHSELVSESLKHEMLKQVQHDKRQKAFTLAEVLITLTIIGVIAALTIPNLIQSYKKHQVEAGLKEAYAIVSNAIKMSETQNGPAYDWNYQTTTNYAHSQFVAENYIFPYLKISKICGRMKTSKGECFSKDNGEYGIKTLKGDFSEYTKTYYTAVLANGMSIGIYSNIFCNYIVVDVNGSNKGTSTIGQDVFYFYTTKNMQNPFGVGVAGLTWPSMVFVRDYTLEQLLGTSVWAGCNKDGYSSAEGLNGANCSAAIAKNGWKIPDNYPVKKW